MAREERMSRREVCNDDDPDVQRGAEILSRALEAERAALASLRQILKEL
ncbi:MAG: hypothetical protein QF768_19140 [Candidatus Latescibacteria bacterium]|jgi:hypothetical protein|nr:hypothetical protein [Candidatus Latescibacterota bacterium]|tara:strand:- start:4138 stop:4284 length:147 start_codon:yes stop_codon:yes gene_type:complete